MKTRIITALVALPLVLLPIWLGGVWCTALFVAVAVIAGLEFFYLMEIAGFHPNRWLGIAWLSMLALNGWLPDLFPLAPVLVAGLLLGRPGEEGLIPPAWIARLVGGNSLWANLFASVLGAFMYFATLTEVPILQGLLGSGMGQGPALALLLAGPALSLPSMLVIRSILGTPKTAVFVLLVIVMATATGMLFGAITHG